MKIQHSKTIKCMKNAKANTNFRKKNLQTDVTRI